MIMLLGQIIYPQVSGQGEEPLQHMTGKLSRLLSSRLYVHLDTSVFGQSQGR